MNKKITDKLGAVKKAPQYQQIKEATEARIQLAIEVNEARREKEWSQQKLAKKVGTTQRIISEIENGDMNVG